MTPRFAISVETSDITKIIQDRLISLEITDNTTEQADNLTIELSDCGRKVMLPDRGSVIKVALGYKDKMYGMGEFVVDSVHIDGPPDRVTIGAYAAPFSNVGNFKPFQSRKSRSFDNITLGNLVRIVASNSGFKAAISPEFNNIKLSHIDQTNESDMNLLTRLARNYGGVMKPTSGHLVFTKKGTGTSVTGKSLGTVSIDRSECISYRAEWSKRANFGKVKTKSHDVETGETWTHEESYGNDDGTEYEHPMLFPDPESAKRGAASILDQNTRLSETINLSLPGRPDLIAEGNVLLTGFKEKMNGEWLIKSVQHSLSASGFTTCVQGETSINRVAGKAKDGSEKRSKENRSFMEELTL